MPFFIHFLFMQALLDGHVVSVYVVSSMAKLAKLNEP